MRPSIFSLTGSANYSGEIKAHVAAASISGSANAQAVEKEEGEWSDAEGSADVCGNCNMNEEVKASQEQGVQKVMESNALGAAVESVRAAENSHFYCKYRGLNVELFILLILSLKTVFFGELYPLETRKLVERLINYVIYKGTFLPLVIPPTVFQTGLWSIWLIVICCLKMFQALARDRFERLNASPSATPWAYFRVFSVFLFALSFNLFWYCSISYFFEMGKTFMNTLSF